MNERIKEINDILAQRNKELETCEDGNRITEIESEVNELIAERSKLLAAQKASIRSKFTSGQDIEVPASNVNNRTAEQLASMNKRQKLAYLIGKQAREKQLNNEEQRAFDAMTTTSTAFVEGSDTVLGQNNAGIFIKTNILMDLLKEEGLVSGIVADISWLNVPGLVEFPYKERTANVQGKKETQNGVKPTQYEWKKLSLQKGWLQTEIKVTDEILLLTDFDLGSYLLGELMQDFNDEWASELIYGTGKTVDGIDHISGLLADLTAKTYTDATKGIIAAITSLDSRYRKGAKVYLAQDVYDSILFATDANGNFKYPIINNSTGITSFSTTKIELDEVLEAGTIVAGNVAKNFKANLLQGVTTETDRDKRAKITSYIVSEFCATKSVPNAFAYYKKG